MNVKDKLKGESKYLKAADLQGREVKLVMSHVDEVELDRDDGSKEQKLCLYFQNRKKGLVLNVTNGGRIMDKYGEESDKWHGEELFLYPEKVDFRGNMVDAIRVRAPVEQAADDDDIAF